MKKLITLFVALCLTIAIGVPAFADEQLDITQTYFPSGEMTKPEAPYLYVQEEYINIFLTQIPELMKIAEDYQIFGENNPEESESFFTINGVYNLCKRAQIDYRFDDNNWASENGDWNAVDGANFDTGSDEYNGICFAVSNSHDSALLEDDNSKMGRIRQADFWYYEPDNDMYSYIHPYMKKVGDDYRLNLDDHTMSVRIRWYVTYEENGQQKTFFSAWSDETSIGKNGTQQDAALPKLEAPMLSEFSLVLNENGTVSVRYYIDIHDSAYEANRYHYINDDYYDSYIIEAQIKTGDGEWTDVYTANANWLINGYRSCGESDDLDISINDEVQLRARIVCGSFEEEPSPWSNIIGTNVGAGAETAAPQGGEPKGGKADQGIDKKDKCKVCGFCPVQPLGICLFIWIAIIAVVMIVIIIAVAVASKKKSKKRR